ncbi:MAG: rubrerythrin family protein [Phycisphaerae bacterium]|nr:rubrerythrin family protein [Phycisphaerae bacterium]
MPTGENLNHAFAGESQASRRYLAFARQAARDGLANVARLFRAAAEAETVHALLELKTAGGIGATAANLETAIAGEAYEFEQMYPKFIAEAAAEKNQPAVEAFRWAMSVERGHHRLYSEALAAVKAGKDVAVDRLFVCDQCGNTVTAPEDICPVCGATRMHYIEVK